MLNLYIQIEFPESTRHRDLGQLSGLYGQMAKDKSQTFWDLIQKIYLDNL